jgi:hypothetical protein
MDSTFDAAKSVPSSANTRVDAELMEKNIAIAAPMTLVRFKTHNTVRFLTFLPMFRNRPHPTIDLIFLPSVELSGI